MAAKLLTKTLGEFEAASSGAPFGMGGAEGQALTAYRERLAGLGASAGKAMAAAAPGSPWTAELKGGDRVLIKPPSYLSMGVELERVRTALHAALERASVLEHRALVTGSSIDAAAFAESAADVQASAADAWRLEALRVALSREHVMRQRAAAEAKQAAAEASFRAAAGARDAAGMNEAMQDMRVAWGIASDARPIDICAVSRMESAPTVGQEPSSRARRVAIAAGTQRRAKKRDAVGAAAAAGAARKKGKPKAAAARRKIRKGRVQ